MSLAEWLVILLSVPTTILNLVLIGKEIKQLEADKAKKKAPSALEKP